MPRTFLRSPSEFNLDPRCCGDGMDTGTRASVEDLLARWYGEERADEALPQLTIFFWFVWEYKLAAVRQWELIRVGKVSLYDFRCSLSQFPLLMPIALQVMHCSASSAASKRNFSTHGYIHSKLRNRLAPERVKKLAHIYFNARNIRDEDLARYSDLEDLIGKDAIEDEDEQPRHRNDIFGS